MRTVSAFCAAVPRLTPIRRAVVQHFIDHILPLFPVITVEELRALDTLSPVTLMSVCAVAACSRKYPWSLLDTVRAFLKTAIEMSDVFSTSSIANVQVRATSLVCERGRRLIGTYSQANLIMAMTSVRFQPFTAARSPN